MKPDQSLFMAHLEEAPFLSGCDAGRWGLHGEAKDIVWPHPIFWVEANKASMLAGKLYLRFTVDNYPTAAPIGCPWDVAKQTRLEGPLWPKVTGKFAKVYRPNWNGGASLYAPCDRAAMSGHDQWRQQFPAWWWQPHFNISKYLAFVHMTLNPRTFENEAA